MKLVLAAAGFPPESDGAEERRVQALARGLAGRGHTVLVVAGADATPAETRKVDVVDGAVRVARIERADRFPGHWQKSSSPSALRLFRAVLAEERPEVVHVLHWRRLTRELVHAAARARVPSVVTLVDAWTHCPITPSASGALGALGAGRVRTDTRAPCDAGVGVHPCVACAGRAAPRTPWVPREAQYMALAERQAALERELVLARGVLAPSRELADAAARFLGPIGARLSIEVVAPGTDAAASDASIDAHLAAYERARAIGAPAVEAPKDEWYAERMDAFRLEQWDRSLASTPRSELGLEAG
ncbi:MAG: glycosyltransferase [Planctomycetes bacterium]|nr:glycosyltransferase [Planctomycetota bacterium]